MKNFFNPQSVAIVGASNEKGKIGQILMENAGQSKNLKLFPVNPKRKKINGIKCYPTVLDIQEKVDLAIIVIPARFVLQVVKECAQKKDPIKNIIIISAGFAESGEAGRKIELELKAIAEKNKLLILGPNCLGSINATDGVNLSFAKNNFPKGNIGLIMQSGALTTALLDRAGEEGLGFSLVTTLGNKTVLNENDFIDYYLKDKKTEMIALYLEDIRAGRRFKKILEKIKNKKPVIVIKAGRSERTKQAIQSHTGAMAGGVEVLKAILEENRAYYTAGIEELFDLLKIFSTFPLPRNNNLAIITNAGGPGVIATDLIEEAENINIAQLQKKTIDQLKAVLPAEASKVNPVDILGDALEDRYQNAIDVVVQDKNVGGILALITPQAQTPLKKIANTLALVNKKYSIPVYPVFITAHNEEAMNVFKKNDLTHFVYPEEIINALNKFFSNQKTKISSEQLSFRKNKQSSSKAEKIKMIAKKDQRQVLFYKEAVSLASIYKFNPLGATYLNNERDVSLVKKFPIVAKIDSQTVLHKRARGGVVLNIENAQSLKKVFQQMQEKFPNDLILTQPMVEPGVELIMGIKNDREFGSVLLIGLGGVATEIFNQKIILSLPTNKENIKQKLENSLIAKYLMKERISLSQVVDEAFKLATLGFENDWIEELDLNPILFYENKTPLAIDIKVLIK
ncbi:MAG TPA: hypothetical protein GX706_02845 [Candidatus Moranbacteria bacterium]|nr:hypothetical protein [Candidatus Moranbacteria bacterium]